MQFLNPSLLWALSLVAIPVLIHLFNFQKLKKISFTNVRWLEEIKVTSSRTRNLKHLLILASRILAIAFLVLAFSQPILPPQKGREDPGDWDRVFILDNSYSMEVAEENENGLTRSRAQIEQIEKLTKFTGDKYFFDLEFSPKDEYPYEQNSLLDRLTDLDFSLKRRTGDEAIQRSNLVSQKRKEVWFFSDFQRNSYSDHPEWKLDSANEYFLIPIQAQDRLNYFIDSVWLAKPFIEIGNTFQVHGIIRASGEAENTETSIRLVVGGEQRASKTIVFDQSQSQEFSFELSLERQDIFRCQIELEDAGVSIDNHFRFIIQPLGGIQITELGTKPNPYLRALYDSEGAFDHIFLSYNNPDLSRIRISDLLIVHDEPAFDGLPDGLLGDFVNEGGNLLLIPSGDSLSINLQRFLRNNGISISRQKSESGFVELAPISKGDPFFEGVFEEFDRRMDLPGVLPVLNVRGWDRLILQLKNDLPFLGYSDRGNGRIYFFTSPLEENFGGFVKHSIFVPVLFRIGAFSQANSNIPLFQRFDRPFFKTRIDQLGSNQLVTLQSGDQKIIPTQRVSGKELIMSVEDIQVKPGFFDLTLEDSIIGSIALNPSGAESELDYILPEEMQNAFSSMPNVTVFGQDNAIEAARTYSVDHVGRPLWKYCLIFVLLFLIAETLILRYL